MKETFKAVPGYEGLYEVSNLGNVKGMKTGKILKPGKTIHGYLHVTLCKDGKTKCLSIHRLVWRAFNGEIPPGLEVNHINEEKTDNRLCNLNLMTHKENNKWGTRIERMIESKKKPVIAFDKVGNFVKEFKSLQEAADWLGKPGGDSNICYNLIGKCRSAYGYVWKYKNPELN